MKNNSMNHTFSEVPAPQPKPNESAFRKPVRILTVSLFFAAAIILLQICA